MYYFVSDTHLGSAAMKDPAAVEALLVRWIKKIQHDGNLQGLFLVGDIFDFWFEYNYVIPKGFTRFLGAICELTDKGIPVHFFTGNHDIWTFGYLERECGMQVHGAGELFTLAGKRVWVEHGDKHCTRSRSYRMMRAVFHSSRMQQIFSWLVHPDVALGFGCQWSASNRRSKPIADRFCGEQEPIIQYLETLADQHSFDYAVLGHLHLNRTYRLKSGAEVFFLGEWITSPSCVALSEAGAELLKIENI